MEVSFEDFKLLDIRVGKILSVEKVENSRNLIKMQVDFGTEKKQAVAGLAQLFKPEQITGKKYVFLCNLEHRKFMGVESQCMILAAEDTQGKITLVSPEEDIEVGSKIT